MSKDAKHTPAPVERQYWRSLEALAETPEELAQLHDEFPPNVAEVGAWRLGRRRFSGLLGASMALAGAGLSGCVRKPIEKIVPFAERPEDQLPGRPEWYATAGSFAGQVMGLRVQSTDGRPTKIEGNPKHPMSLGGTNVWAQSSILDMYDPDRSILPTSSGTDTSLKAFDAALAKLVPTLRQTSGEGLAILAEALPSPTYERLLAGVLEAYPNAKLYVHDASQPTTSQAGAELIGLGALHPLYALDKADVVVALDSDFLGTEGDSVLNSNLFASRRRLGSPSDRMNRLYAVEAAFTATGAAADHRLKLQSSQIAGLLGALAARLFADGLTPPRGTANAVKSLEGHALPAGVDDKWIAALAADLRRNWGQSLILVGERQPARAHALAHLLNESLGNVGRTVRFIDRLEPAAGSISELRSAIDQGSVVTLVMLGGNPVYDVPADIDFGAKLESVALSIHLSAYRNETSKLSTWHVPRSHFLERWGDLRSSDGTVSVQQPLILPLYESLSEIELLGRLLGGASSTYDAVRATWSAKHGSEGIELENRWRTWLEGGVIEQEPPEIKTPEPKWDELAKAWADDAVPPGWVGNLEIDFVLDAKIYDGRWANNGWLQELPGPMDKLTWGNAAVMSPKLATALGVAQGDRVRLTLRGRTIELPVFPVPGTAEGSVIVSRGYGRKELGRIADGVGANANLLRTSDAPAFSRGLGIERVGKTQLVATTQEHFRMGVQRPPDTGLGRHRDEEEEDKPQIGSRPIVREATLQQYRANPTFARDMVHGPPEKSFLFEEPHPRDGYQWGMSIDLNACVGCNTCVIACQAENNIPIVGIDRVSEGREMHWIRIDRYYAGDPDDPEAVFQPMPCQHCENAPCETVCPVAATSHSPEGLNDMAYNRCIGTRYCSNNCPYKVRRFNFFNYNLDIDPALQMQKNPNVTVRFRGVMEKCSYCVQRIQAAKIEAKRSGVDHIPDGSLVVACQQACPTKAIAFGDMNDPQSEVVARKKLERDYTVLSELNNHPRTTYLARVRNPNPELV